LTDVTSPRAEANKAGNCTTGGPAFVWRWRFAVALVAALVVLARLAHDGRLFWLDQSITTAILAHSDISIRRIARTLGQIGEAGVWDLTCLAAALVLAALQRRSTAVRLICGLAIVELGTLLIKLVVGGDAPSFWSIRRVLALDGFPSGHVARVLVTLGILGLSIPGKQGVAFAIGQALLAGLVMGWARIETRSHAPSDILGAILLGSITLAMLLPGRTEKRRSDIGQADVILRE
jgi:membrane-associated phospholipid phosphatase